MGRIAGRMILPAGPSGFFGGGLRSRWRWQKSRVSCERAAVPSHLIAACSTTKIDHDTSRQNYMDWLAHSKDKSHTREIVSFCTSARLRTRLPQQERPKILSVRPPKELELQFYPLMAHMQC